MKEKFSNTSMGPSLKLKEHVVQRAFDYRRKGAPVSKTDIKDNVQRIERKSKLKTKFINGRPGNKFSREIH